MEFFELSLGIAVVAFAFRIFDQAWDNYPGLPSLNLSNDVKWISWLGIIGWYALMIAAYLWIISVVNPNAWKQIRAMLGWGDSEASAPPVQTLQPSLRGVFSPNELLQCPRCNITGYNLVQSGPIELKRVKGLTVFGRDFGFVVRRPADRVDCRGCGYAFYRLIEG